MNGWWDYVNCQTTMENSLKNLQSRNTTFGFMTKGIFYIIEISVSLYSLQNYL